MKERDTQDNMFLEKIYNLYDAAYSVRTDKEPSYQKKVHFSFINDSWSEKEKRYKRLDDAVQKAKEFINNTCSIAPSFDTLWEFCEFIRVIEKIFFYRNEPDNIVSAEMELGDLSGSRKLCIKNVKDDYEIRLTLEHFIYGSDMITINVVREYGKEMQNTYKAVDGEMPFEDSSDIYLIDEINICLEHIIKDTFLSIVKQIINDLFEDKKITEAYYNELLFG